MFRLMQAVRDNHKLTDEEQESIGEDLKLEVLIAMLTLEVAEKYKLTPDKVIDSVLNSLEDDSFERNNN